MGRKVEVPISPRVLGWAISEGGFTSTDFAARIKVDLDTLEGWLQGRSRPGKTEFRRIVDALHRPSALFFRPDPPPASVPPELRSVPSGRRELNPDELRSIRSTLRLQRLLSEWLAQAGRDVVNMPLIEEGTQADLAARLLRAWLGVSVEEQRSWISAGQALSSWRSAITERGVAVFLLGLGSSGVRGFSAWHDHLPVIAVNTNYNVQARIFTVFHELAHLATRTQAACTDVPLLSKKSPEIERWCEDAASVALLPEDAVLTFLDELGGVEDELDLVRAVSAAFHVSLRASAIRIGELGQSDDRRALYRRIDRIAVATDRDKGRARGKPQDRVAQRLTQVGPHVVALYDEALNAGFVHERDVRDHLRLEAVEFEEAKTRLEQLAQ